MELTVKQAQDILNFVPTIEYLIKVFDSSIVYQNKYNECILSDEGENFLRMQDDNEKYVVTSIEILFQSGNMDDDDTVRDYMTNTLGIDKDSFEVEWDMLGGNVWMRMSIH